MTTIQTFQVSRTAHVYESGMSSDDPSFLWIVAHGYGQTAQRIIKKFDVLDHKHRVVAPEGLNKFYWHDEKRTPSATWMTSHHRLDEIHDYCRYLDQVLAHYTEGASCKVILFGFSQGATTLYRWLHASRMEIHAFVNWAGWIPDDLDLSEMSDILPESNHHFIYGDEDQFLSQERIDKLSRLFQDAMIVPTVHTFAGKHHIPRTELSRLAPFFIGN